MNPWLVFVKEFYKAEKKRDPNCSFSGTLKRAAKIYKCKKDIANKPAKTGSKFTMKNPMMGKKGKKGGDDSVNVNATLEPGNTDTSDMLKPATVTTSFGMGSGSGSGSGTSGGSSGISGDFKPLDGHDINSTREWSKYGGTGSRKGGKKGGNDVTYVNSSLEPKSLTSSGGASGIASGTSTIDNVKPLDGHDINFTREWSPYKAGSAKKRKNNKSKKTKKSRK
jgi:hypothetical protein